MDKLIDLSQEGINITNESGEKVLKAFFMSRRADLLTGKITLLQYECHNIKLSSDWFQFSLEIDKIAYENFASEIKKTETEINTLLKNALTITEQSNKKQVGLE